MKPTTQTHTFRYGYLCITYTATTRDGEPQVGEPRRAAEVEIDSVEAVDAVHSDQLLRVCEEHWEHFAEQMGAMG